MNQAEDRKLEQLLGADRSVFADLQTGLAILGPLIASAATAFLPAGADYSVTAADLVSRAGQ